MLTTQVHNQQTLDQYVDQYRNRGLTNSMISRVFNVAYDQGHSSGYNAVAIYFKGLMEDLFLMDEIDNNADLGV